MISVLFYPAKDTEFNKYYGDLQLLLCTISFSNLLNVSYRLNV